MTSQEHIEAAETWADKAGNTDPYVSTFTAHHRRQMSLAHSQIALAQIALEQSQRDEYRLTVERA